MPVASLLLLDVVWGQTGHQNASVLSFRLDLFWRLNKKYEDTVVNAAQRQLEKVHHRHE